MSYLLILLAFEIGETIRAYKNVHVVTSGEDFLE